MTDKPTSQAERLLVSGEVAEAKRQELLKSMHDAIPGITDEQWAAVLRAAQPAMDTSKKPARRKKT